MWRSSNSKLAAALAAALMLAGCGGYAFDEAAVSGSYSMAAAPAAGAAQAQEFSLLANAEVTLNAATGRANVMLGNPAQNTRNCRVTLVLDETGETLYQTQVLAPGQRVAYAQLDADVLEGGGPWQATAQFEIIDEETGRPIGVVEAGVSITIE